ncbi:MAG: sulfatase-like hydrolase/transferase [Steroidobacteraceae bacterium]
MDIVKKAILVLASAGLVLALAADLPGATAGAVLPASPGVPESRRGTSARPNVILILADDLGYADVSAYPGGRFRSPNIERIARDGVLFTDGYATAPVCGPSRAGLLTGRYQERFGFDYNNGPARRDVSQGLGLSTRELTLAQLLQRAGYYTGMIGKWHLGSAPQFYPMNRGFDEFVGFLPGETSYIDPRLPGVHMSFGPVGDGVIHAALERAAEDRKMDTSNDADAGRKLTRLARYFSRGPLNQIIEGRDRRVVHNDHEYLTDYFGGRAAGFIRDHSRSGRPYFLYLAFNAPHAPHMVTAKYYDRFPQVKDHQERVYAGMIAALDDNIGKVLDAVRASGQEDNTLIIFASDNGCAAYFPGLCSCWPLRGGKLSYYEGGIRVPFMMSWPGHLPRGLVYRRMVSLLDVVPTAVAAAGGTLPAGRVYDGVDQTPYLTAHTANHPHDMLAWSAPPLQAIREGDWKLWESSGGEDDRYGKYQLLFNLSTDLNESHDLAGSDPEEVHRLAVQLSRWSGAMIAPKWPTKRPTTYDVCGRKFTLPI